MKLSEEDRAFFNSRIPKCSLCGTTKVFRFKRGGELLNFAVGPKGGCISTGPHLKTCPGRK